MTLATSITESYLERSHPFFTSAVQYWPGRRICFTIGFTTTIEGWECIAVPTPAHSWQPTNRTGYASLQHGEWLDHISLQDTEMVLFADSDMILQREFDLDFPYTDKLLATQCSYPQLKLYEVVRNLNCTKRKDKFFDKYKFFIEREFCACWMLTSVKTWRLLYEGCKERYSLLASFKHHAAWQLLINVTAVHCAKVTILPPMVCNADWYTGSGATVRDNELWVDMVQNTEGTTSEKVYFRHTKFN